MIIMPKINHISLHHDDIFYPSRANRIHNKKITVISEAQGKGISILCKTQFQSAFTLIELLVALAVLTIILMVAAPAFRTTLMNSRLSANSNSLISALNFGRNKALYLSSNVIVCPFRSAGSTACGGNWSAGIIVVSLPASGANTLLLSQQFAPTDPTVSSTAASVTFDPHGLSTTQSNFKLCDSRGATFARSIQVLATGFVQIGPTPGQAVWDNSALTCP